MTKEVVNKFSDWIVAAKNLGWVHLHDSILVLDDSDSGECVGEFDPETNEGWIYSECLNRKSKI